MVTVIVATDFSPASENAFRFCLEMTGVSGSCRIIVTHIYKPKPHGTLGGSQLKRFRENELAEARERTVRFSRLYPDTASEDVLTQCHISTAVEEGYASENLIELAAQHKADVIVIGSKSHPGMLKTWFGQVSQKVIYNAPCPVIIVPESHRTDSPTIIAGICLDGADESEMSNQLAKVWFVPDDGFRLLRIRRGAPETVSVDENILHINYKNLASLIEVLNGHDFDAYAILSGTDSGDAHERIDIIHALYDHLEKPLMCL